MSAAVVVHSQKCLKKSLNIVGAEAPIFFCDVIRHKQSVDILIKIVYNYKCQEGKGMDKAI